MDMHSFYAAIEPYVIWLYRISGYAFVDFLIGTLVLALMTVIIGELTISLAFLAGRKRIGKTNAELVRYQNMSVDALKAGDKESYHASNKLANDAFGRSFFMQIALSAAFLWPIFFALDWIQYRFLEVEFELLFVHRTVGPVCVFITLYAAAFLLFKRVKLHLPYFRRVTAIIDSCQTDGDREKSLDYPVTNDACPKR